MSIYLFDATLLFFATYEYCHPCCLIFRFDPMMVAKLRPETDIPGLYMTGQVCNHENLPFGYTTFIVVFHSKIAIICIIYCLYMGEIIKNLS